MDIAQKHGYSFKGAGLVKKKDFAKKIIGVVAVMSMIMSTAGCGEAKYKYEAPTEPEEAGIFVEPVEGIRDDFIRGVDISSVISEEQSGVVYKNKDGVEEDIFKILADAGVNYIRVRVWNDPYDENGNGYGGGNNDTAKAVEIGKRAAQYNMKLLVDYHYSDFWADPAKQFEPKTWAGKSADEKAELAYEFTLESLNAILDGGADVGMVQLGNETNNHMSGEEKWAEISKIVSRGRDAVMETGEAHKKEIKTVLHFTNPENFDGIKGLLRKLDSCGVQYDVFALSYYPYWHGTLENLSKVIEYVHEHTGKEVMIAETSYCYTLEEGDGFSNSVSEKDLNKNYAASVQSQANAVRDIFDTLVKTGDYTLGVFYWEPAWVPVAKVDYNNADAESVLADNRKKWEEFGSGWASSYAGSYDKDDAGKWYGGSSWDNQAMFDFDGKALDSLYVFKYLKYGATAPLKVDFANDLSVTVNPGSEFSMPETADVCYNDRSKNGQAKVTWNSDEVSRIDTAKTGEYTVNGTFEDGTAIKCTVNVANVNWVKNPSFEEEDRSMWEFEHRGDTVLDYQQKETDAYTGEWAMHYWRSSAVAFRASQTITGLADGKYSLSVYTQGGDSGAGAKMFLFAETGGETYTKDYSVNGWCEWQHPEIKGIEVKDGTVTIGVEFEGGEGAWGTFDDFYLCIED